MPQGIWRLLEGRFLIGIGEGTPLTTRTGTGRVTPAFPRTVAPTFVIDISDHAAQKQRAVACYRSQLYDPASTEPETALSSEAFLHRLEARQKFFGSLISVAHAEAFVVKEALNIHDPVALLTRRMNMYS